MSKSSKQTQGSTFTPEGQGFRLEQRLLVSQVLRCPASPICDARIKDQNVSTVM